MRCRGSRRLASKPASRGWPMCGCGSDGRGPKTAARRLSNPYWQQSVVYRDRTLDAAHPRTAEARCELARSLATTPTTEARTLLGACWSTPIRNGDWRIRWCWRASKPPGNRRHAHHVVERVAFDRFPAGVANQVLDVVGPDSLPARRPQCTASRGARGSSANCAGAAGESPPAAWSSTSRTRCARRSGANGF